MSGPHHDVEVKVNKFQGGKAWMTYAAVIGVLCTALTVGAMLTGSRDAQFSYLMGFCYWAGISFASLLLLMIFHAFRAKWMTVVRRPLEAMATTSFVFLLLFIPVVLVMKSVFSWVEPDPKVFTEHQLHLLHHKASYLNSTFFIVRGFGYFLITGIVASLLFGWSTKQDTTGEVALTGKARKLGTGGIPLIALVITFASFDWLMSLDPTWFSTMFGVYFFAGSMMSTFAVLILACWLVRGADSFGDYVSPEHLHNLGKLLFAFTAFWAYISFSQMMLIWMAGLPEETPFFILRMQPTWIWLGVFLVVGHFLVPFFMLLSRGRKRTLGGLAPMAVWALFVHAADLYWLIFPALDAGRASMHWSIITAFVGIGGLTIAAAIWRVRGHYMVPVKDPFLNVSLRYRQP